MGSAQNNTIKVNILTGSRFHVLDLARELDLQGFNVKFYTFLPVRRCAKYNLPKSCCVSLAFPFLLLEVLSIIMLKLCKKRYHFRKRMQDSFTASILREADVTIAMSGQYVKSLRKARKDGSIIILERGSKHILEQKRILDAIPGADKVSDIDVQRELEGYDIADYVSIPSDHVKDSFLKYGYPEERLYINPYGTDLSAFYPIPVAKREFDAIFVGNWTYQKGCDLLIDAVKDSDIRLLHVGALGDVVFPKCSNMVHVDPVDQNRLVDYYKMAKCLVLPSRQDGFGMVLTQAISCGLPVVCSMETGGKDILRVTENCHQVVILHDLMPNSIREGIIRGISIFEENKEDLGIIRDGIDKLTWKAYGIRYA